MPLLLTPMSTRALSTCNHSPSYGAAFVASSKSYNSSGEPPATFQAVCSDKAAFKQAVATGDEAAAVQHWTRIRDGVYLHVRRVLDSFAADRTVRCLLPAHEHLHSRAAELLSGADCSSRDAVPSDLHLYTASEPRHRLVWKV